MKNKYLIIILLAIGIFSSCSKDRKATDFIPNDALFVARIDNMSMIKKANIGSAQSQNALGLLMKGFFKEMPNSDTPIKDPSSSGIDFMEDAYIFATPTTEVISFSLIDANKFKEVLLSTGMVTEDNISKSKDINSVLYNTETLISWDDERLLILKNTSYEETELATIAKSLFSQKRENSISENENFKKFMEKKADISIFGTSEFFSHFIKKSSPTTVSIKDQLSGTIPVTYINFNEGNILAETKIIFTDKTKEENANEIFKDIFGYNSGKHLDYFDKMPDALITANIKGENLKKFLTREGLSKQIGDIPIININDIISNLDGDITIGTSTPLDTTNKKMMFTLLIDLKDPAAIRSMFAQFSHPSFRVLQQTGEDSYKFFNDSYFLGIKESMLYLSTDNGFAQKSPQKNELDKAIADKLKKSKILIHGNSPSAVLLSSQNVPEQNMLSSIFSFCDSYTMSATENLDIITEIGFTDKTQNSLAVIIQNLDKISNEIKNKTINE